MEAEKVYMPMLITKRWKKIHLGRNARYRVTCFIVRFCHYYTITSLDYYRKIMRGETKIAEQDVGAIDDILKFCEAIK
jgi:hypothetical protein